MSSAPSIHLPWEEPLQLYNMGWFPLRRHSAVEYRHPTYALHIHQYRGRVQIGETALDLAPGDITLTPPDTPSRYHLEHDGEHWCVHFNPASSSTTPSTSLELPLHRPASARNLPQIPYLSWLAEAARRRNAPDPATARLAQDAAETGVRELLLWLHLTREDQSEPTGGPTRAGHALAELVALLERRYERDWSAKDLAAHTGLNADYLARQFRQRYGCTIAQFLLRRRIEAAQHLLRSTTLRIKEIGAAVGLPDPQKFNKDFRAATGHSPTQFRINQNL